MTGPARRPGCAAHDWRDRRHRVAVAGRRHHSADRTPRRVCVDGLVHGDLSSRNILLEPSLPPAIFDFEGSSHGCVYDDLATQNDHGTGLDEAYLYVHIVWWARWVLQWEPDFDQPFAAKIIDLAPHILRRITAAVS
jgi:hypothetical protein